MHGKAYLTGYALTVTGLLLLYAGNLVAGALLFIFGGYLAEKLWFSIRSTGVVVLVISIAFGIHNDFSLWLLLIMLLSFVMACFTSRRGHGREGRGGWGFDIELSDFGSGGGDGGGCGGGGD